MKLKEKLSILMASVALALVVAPALAKPASRGPFTFSCMGDAPTTLIVTYLGATTERARIAFRGETVVAKHAVSADGALYTAKDVEFWNKGDDAVVEWRGEKLKCALLDD